MSPARLPFLMKDSPGFEAPMVPENSASKNGAGVLVFPGQLSTSPLHVTHSTRVMTHFMDTFIFWTPSDYSSIIYSILSVLNKLLKEICGCTAPNTFLDMSEK